MESKKRDDLSRTKGIAIKRKTISKDWKDIISGNVIDVAGLCLILSILSDPLSMIRSDQENRAREPEVNLYSTNLSPKQNQNQRYYINSIFSNPSLKPNLNNNIL